jgi:hypothetical protein
MAQDPIQIVIECAGGLVRNVHSSLANVEVHVVDWDTAEGFTTHEHYRASPDVAEPEYFADLAAAGVLRPPLPEEAQHEYVALGLTVERGRTPHTAW